jgi:hypothetical protein
MQGASANSKRASHYVTGRILWCRKIIDRCIARDAGGMISEIHISLQSAQGAIRFDLSLGSHRIGYEEVIRKSNSLGAFSTSLRYTMQSALGFYVD